MTDQSFSVELRSLFGFAQELRTQLEGIAVPMNTLAEQAGAPPQFGAFAEASDLAQSQQAAVEEMHGLLGQVQQAIDFAQDVTDTVASGYQHADQEVAASMRLAGPAWAAPRAAGSGYPAQHGLPGYAAGRGSAG
jgi:hypothetical protein